MSIADKIWEALAQVIKMNERVIRLSAQVGDLAAEMREVDKRLVRVETMLEIAMAGKPQASGAPVQRRMLPKPSKD